jgi:SAM-dependent methyltransferase
LHCETQLVLPDLNDPLSRQRFEAAIARAESVTDSDPVRRAAKVRKLVGPELATEALAQSELRRRARDKFGVRAERLYFTSAGLEQSTRHELADHRAGRFARAGLAGVLDLCCGIGADLLAFARAGLAVAAVERDPETVAIARANLAGAGARISAGSAEDSNWRHAESVFIDPARRGAAGRTFDPAAYSPGIEFVTAVIEGARFAAAKLGPGLDHALIPAGAEAEWVSYRSGVKEMVLWSAGFTEPGVHRRASVFANPATAAVQLTDADLAEPAIGPVGAYLYEPDGAVIRAGLVQHAAAVISGWRLDAHLAYLSSDQPAETVLARGYRVVDVLPYSVKRLRNELLRRGVGIVEIKKRGVDVDPARLRKELKPQGPNSMTVLLARVGDRHLAILADPVVTGRASA